MKILLKKTPEGLNHLDVMEEASGIEEKVEIEEEKVEIEEEKVVW